MSTDHRTSLEVPISAADHVRGGEGAAVTLVEYGDFECPYCGRAYPVVKELERRFGARLRVVFRHNPRADQHAHAESAAEAAEAAGAQGKFWEMHDRLFENQKALGDGDLAAHAAAIGLDVARFTEELRAHTHMAHVHAEAVTGAHTVRTNPTFFINGVRFEDTPDLATLAAAVERAVGGGA
jgi:protein-disulfide isomerase